MFIRGGLPTERCDAAVIVSRVENDEIQELAHLEGSPDSQAIVQIRLSKLC